MEGGSCLESQLLNIQNSAIEFVTVLSFTYRNKSRRVFVMRRKKKTCISVVFHLRYLQDGNKCPGSWLLAFHSCSSVCSKYRVSDVERVADPSVIESDTGRDLASQRGLKPRDMGRVKERWSDGRSCRPLPRLALAPFATASHPVHGTASPV